MEVLAKFRECHTHLRVQWVSRISHKVFLFRIVASYRHVRISSLESLLLRVPSAKQTTSLISLVLLIFLKTSQNMTPLDTVIAGNYTQTRVVSLRDHV